MFGNLFITAIASIFINNFVLTQFMGVSPFLGTSKKMTQVCSMGVIVIFVMTLASIVTYPVNYYFLIPLNLKFLRILFFLVIIAAIVQIIELFLKKKIPELYHSLGIYLPLVTTNCAVLGVVFQNSEITCSFVEATVHAFFGGLGFFLVLFIMVTIREKLDMATVPKAFKGIPAAFISAGLMAMAFLAIDKSILIKLFS
ncbi:MAG: electron transport complex subunit RsxA [Spirochaetales bacterium]|nr:electron transport complex subunit RsxA [Spirochaetales bacterium]